MHPQPPFLVVRAGQSFWIETRAAGDCSATLQAFREGCFRDAWCYDSTGSGWPILVARLKQRPSFLQWLMPWKQVAVELHLGSRIAADPAGVIASLAAILRSGNEFCDSLRTPPHDLVTRFQNARELADIIQVARTCEQGSRVSEWRFGRRGSGSLRD
jgi:hypothetical protein